MQGMARVECFLGLYWANGLWVAYVLIPDFYDGMKLSGIIFFLNEIY